MIYPHLSHYFSQHVKREVREVYWHAAIYNLALALAYIFEPIYLFKLGYNLVWIFAFYLQVYVWYSVLVFLGAKVAGKIGYKHSIFISSLFYFAYWITLYRIGQVNSLFYIAPILFALQKSFFWPAYNADIAANTIMEQRGREVGVLFSVIEVVMIIGPFLGGFISARFGFLALFSTSSILMLLAVIPLFRSPEIYNGHTFRFQNFLKLARRFWQNFFGYWGYAEDLILGTLWPIYIFLFLPNFFGVGLITTVASIIATVLMLYVGKLTDRLKKVDLIQLSSFFYGLTWVLRLFATNLPSILAFDVLTKTGKGMVSVPLVSLTYEIAGGKSSDYAIAYCVFYEFSLAIGKIVTCLLAMAILAVSGSIYYVFLTVGIMTMLYGLLSKKTATL